MKAQSSPVKTTASSPLLNAQSRSKADEFDELIEENSKKNSRVKLSSPLACLSAIAILLLLLLVIAVIGIFIEVAYVHNIEEINLPEWKRSPNALSIYQKAAVASDNGFCSEVGRDILVEGGNAVDAAVASMFCVGAMNPHSAGLGGGHFMTIYNSTTGECVAIDAREVAPAAASRDMYSKDKSASKTGWKALGVPGEIAGLWTAFRKYGSGRIAWSKLIEPTIHILENGIVLSTAVGKALKARQSRAKIFSPNSTMNIFFNKQENRLYEAGDIMTRPVLAQTLRELAQSDDPAEMFYNGSIASRIVKEFQDNGALITAQDLASYKANVHPNPIMAELTGTGLVACGPPPPSSAAITISILQTMNSFGITPSSNLSTVEDTTETLHRFIESMKFAYARRVSLGDPAFVANERQVADYMLTPEYARMVQSMITEHPHNASYYLENSQTFVEDHGTSHLSLIDADGNAVAATTTINIYFGAGVRSISTGIIWNDEMDDFSSPNQTNAFNLAPSPSNFIAPGKRPASSMAPLVIFDKNTKQPRLVIGGAGGSRIISSVAYSAMRQLWFNETVKMAIDAPRLHDQVTQKETYFEDNFPEVYLNTLEAKGHVIKAQTGRNGVITAVSKEKSGVLEANSDFRKGPSSFTAGY